MHAVRCLLLAVVLGQGTAACARDAPPLRLLLTGDVMTGRGVDQIQRHSVDPLLHESYVRSAEGYVELAERSTGPIPREVAPEYVWGDALAVLARHQPQPRIVNLETAVTTAERPWPGKGIHYRMHPANTALLAAAGIDCAVLANNHVLDWGHEGLAETLSVLQRAGLATPGAGSDATRARAPARLAASDGTPVLVFAMAAGDSGVPADWRAAQDRAGVHLLADLSEATARAEAVRMREAAGGEGIVVASIHWGGNWGYAVPEAHRRFAQVLIDEGGVDLVHGHSSHHPKGVEVHAGRLILYGAGDLINDYEGIGGHEAFRPQLTALYLPELASDGTLLRLRIVPMRIARFRLQHADAGERAWLQRMFAGESRGVRVQAHAHEILVHPAR